MHRLIQIDPSSISSLVVFLVAAAVASWGAAAFATNSASVQPFSASPYSSLMGQASLLNGQSNCTYSCYKFSSASPGLVPTHSGVATCATDDAAWCRSIVVSYCTDNGFFGVASCKSVSPQVLQK